MDSSGSLASKSNVAVVALMECGEYMQAWTVSPVGFYRV
jgi:hypothetical protein